MKYAELVFVPDRRAENCGGEFARVDFASGYRVEIVRRKLRGEVQTDLHLKVIVQGYRAPEATDLEEWLLVRPPFFGVDPATVDDILARVASIPSRGPAVRTD